MGWKNRPRENTEHRRSNMTTASKKNRPSHRVSFARIIGSDETGDKLGSAREIGSRP
jgi:hypothetical protein